MHAETQLKEQEEFDGIPAWRIAQLRAALRGVEARGADAWDEGVDLSHRAARRRFARGRLHALASPGSTARSALKPKTTRKGRRFPIAKQIAIWRIILALRPLHWRQGDMAPYGKLRQAHALATKVCRAAGLTAPRYRTIQMLWHRGVPSPAVMAALER